MNAMTYIEIYLVVMGVLLMSFSALNNTKNFISGLLYKVFPLLAGLSLVLIGLKVVA